MRSVYIYIKYLNKIYKNIFQLGKPTESLAEEDRDFLMPVEILTLHPGGERTETTDLSEFCCQIFILQILLMSIMVIEPSYDWQLGVIN